jgi:membrane associated rhomboid family serine protease
MIETDQSSEAEDDWVQVGQYSTLEQAYDHGLVILAMGEACRVGEGMVPGEFDLHAESSPAVRISEELEAYGREISVPVARPVAGNEWARYSAGGWFCAVWVLVLMAVFYRQSEDASLVGRAASSSVGLMGRGEWWRPFTALFLHADVGHLAGNLVGGVLFAMLVARMVGPLLGWTLIFACGTLGNVITAGLTYPEPFVSLGASTAVFAALGILSGVGIAETLRERARLPWLRIMAPVIAGIVLLGFLGGGHDPHTDVLGHVFGFSSGLIAGAAVGALEEKRSGAAISS